MNQNLSLYQIFYVTAVTGNISRAAEKLFISQPAVSRSIKRLEESLGTALFARSSRGVRLTEDGELLFSHVKTAVQSLDLAENQLKLRHKLGVRRLRIGASATLCKYVLLPYLKDFIAQHPNIQVTISCQSTNHTLQMLENGELDVGLTGRPDFLRDLLFYPVMQIQDTFAASGEYLENSVRLYGTATEDLLENGTLMLLDKENLTRQYVDRYLAGQSLFPENVLETTSMDLLIDFAKTGLGIACVIREFVERELREQTLVELSPALPMKPREIGLMYRKNRENRDMAEELISLWQ